VEIIPQINNGREYIFIKGNVQMTKTINPIHHKQEAQVRAFLETLGNIPPPLRNWFLRGNPDVVMVYKEKIVVWGTDIDHRPVTQWLEGRGGLLLQELSLPSGIVEAWIFPNDSMRWQAELMIGEPWLYGFEDYLVDLEAA
jgi:hypothetical protein